MPNDSSKVEELNQQLLPSYNELAELAGSLAHEIKNPLGGLRGAAQLLERELNDEDLKEYTRIIIGEADRLRGLVNRMLGPNQWKWDADSVLRGSAKELIDALVAVG